MFLEVINRYKKVALLLIILLAVGGAAYSAYIYQSRIGKVAVPVYAVPTDMNIDIAGYGNTQPGTVYLKPGAYRVKASREGFAESQFNLIVREDNNPTIDLALLPESEDAKKIAQENRTLYGENESRGGKLANDSGEAFKELNPIVSLLPFKDPYYSIGYKSPDNKTIKITITTPSPLYRYYATEKIRNWGYDPTDFEIIYNDFKNPLE